MKQRVLQGKIQTDTVSTREAQERQVHMLSPSYITVLATHRTGLSWQNLITGLPHTMSQWKYGRLLIHASPVLIDDRYARQPYN
ncbi:hypothetical protein AMATHDRAFT_62365, partial [Amanita thiersii Skay4041]